MKIFILIFLLYCGYYSNAQDESLRFCGTPNNQSAWLQHYQQLPHDYRTGGDTVLYVPLSIHLVGTDNGVGHFRERILLDRICQLNLDFEASSIQFFIEGEVHYLNNSDWYEHQTLEEGAEMMAVNNIENTINCYVVQYAVGACAYSLPYGGVSMKKSCASGMHAWTHEIGHYLSLPHPFLGWEGGPEWDGSIDQDFNTPAPEEVYFDCTYDKDTLILDTLIIDTVEVERVNDPNCENTGDGFCDTPSDYLYYIWECDSEHKSTQRQLDPDSVEFYSDGTLFMSYARDTCVSRFSDDQIAAMRANLLDEKIDYLYNQTLPILVSDEAITQLSPIDDELVQFDNVYIEWDPIPGATHYVIEISRLLPIVKFDTIITNNFIWLNDLENNREYHWRVRPFNRHQSCTEMSDYATFMTGEISSTYGLSEIGYWHIFPSLLGQEQNISIKIESLLSLGVKFNLVDMSGRVLLEKQLNTQNGLNLFDIALPTALENGMYIVVLNSDKGKMVKKIIVSRH